MIKSIEVTALARSAEDFKLLIQLFDLLGMRKGFGGANEKSRSAEFFPSETKLQLIYRKNNEPDVDIVLMISDPDTALLVVTKQGFTVIRKHSGPEPSHLIAYFDIELPGGTRVRAIGPRVFENVVDTDHLAVEGSFNASGKRFGLVVSRFNSFITERLLTGAIDGLVKCGSKLSDLTIVRVPGAFEIPSAARALAETKKYDAIVCIGCLLRGDTAHYDVIVNEVARGIGQSAQETGVPHAFGVLTCENLEQAIDRAGLKMGNKGFEAALAAVEMANLKSDLGPQTSDLRKNKSGKRTTPSRKRKS
jgi:6,7-dimethyl-8-ribityllumazine synthase